MVVKQRGYPICGAVVYLLASVWLQVCIPGLPVEDIKEVEVELARIAGEEGGKHRLHRAVAWRLQQLMDRLEPSGADPFASSLERRLCRDRLEWPPDLVRMGGSVTASLGE